ncbi:MAG: SRPBCC family protein [Gammaproteobacteria bacterium]
MTAPQLHGQYEVITAVIINTPSIFVWDVLKDFGNVSDWAPTVSESHYITSSKTGVGTGRHCHVVGFGNIQEFVTDWYEGQGFAYSVTALGPLAVSSSSWWLTRIDDHATKLEVVFSYDVRFGLFGKILHKLLMRKKLEKSLPETLAATKKHVESNYSSTSMQTPLTAVSA